MSIDNFLESPAALCERLRLSIERSSQELSRSIASEAYNENHLRLEKVHPQLAAKLRAFDNSRLKEMQEILALLSPYNQN